MTKPWKFTRSEAEQIADQFVKLATEQAGQPYAVEHAACVNRVQIGLALDEREQNAERGEQLAALGEQLTVQAEQNARLEKLLTRICDALTHGAPLVDPEAEKRRRAEEEAKAAFDALPEPVREAMKRQLAAAGAK